MNRHVVGLAFSVACGLFLGAPGEAFAKKKAPPPKAAAVASEQTVRAIAELAGKFQWGISPDEAKKIVETELAAAYDDRIKKEPSPFKQDVLRKEMGERLEKFKASYIKFENQDHKWDVSIVGSEFAHLNDEAMMVLWEKDQRRFLLFYQDHLWKQFIAFNTDNPVFKDKTFDDFAQIMVNRYGTASKTLRKLATSDEKTLDHLEWPPAGDYVLWAIDLTNFYGNFCLSVFQNSKVAEILRGREVRSPKRPMEGHDIVDSLMKQPTRGDENADIIDQVTGKQSEEVRTSATKAKPAATASGKKGGSHGKAKPEEKEPKEETKTVDPLEGTNF